MIAVDECIVHAAGIIFGHWFIERRPEYRTLVWNTSAQQAPY